ncbi:MAG TPA: zf-HC2 domain-containing protein [Ktedonobacterales bacterium]
MHTDWDAQRERLSAYLDGALSADERAELAAHLPGCAECRRELAALRQTKALLSALPVPTPPRSFALPTTLRPLPARRPAPPLWAGPLQTLGAIAAVVGLAFFVWAALPHPLTQSAGSAAYAPAVTNSGADTSVHVPTSPSATSSPREGVASAGSGSPTTAPAPATPIPTYTPPTKTQFAKEAQPFPTLPVTGGILLVGGAAALAIGGLARRRDDGPTASDIAG